MNKKIEIRYPFVPEFNSDQTDKIANFLKTLKNRYTVRVLPYHNYAGSKYEALDIKNTLPGVLPKDDDIQKAEKSLNKLF